MKILYLTSRFPYPLEKGDKLRAYNQIKELSKNHQVILYAISENKILDKWEDEIKKVTYYHQTSLLTPLQKYFHLAIGIFNKLPYQINYFFNKTRKRNIEKLLVRFNPDVVFCQLIRMSEFARHLEKPKVLDYMDAFSKGVQRRMNEEPFYIRKIYELEYKRLLRYEAYIHKDFDASIIISTADKEAIPLQPNEEMSIIRNGVNFDYFKPQPLVKKEFDLVFTGNMSYPPNVSAVLFLYHDILPLLKTKYPEIKILIAGANPVAKLRELHSENFVITGWVEEINEYYAKSKIFIAPMLIGTGLQNKLLEAMAMQLPCITSPLVNNSLGAKANTEILIAENANAYAAYVFRLLEDESFAKAISMAGYEFVTTSFSWSNTIDELNDIFLKITR